MPHLVVTVLGHRNTGKTTTWNTLLAATVKTGKRERRLYLNSAQYVNVFLVSGSPEERDQYVGDIIKVKKPVSIDDTMIIATLMSTVLLIPPSKFLEISSTDFPMNCTL